MDLDLNTTIAILEESATFRAHAAQVLIAAQGDKFAPKFAKLKEECRQRYNADGKIPAIKYLRTMAHNDQPFIDYLCKQMGVELGGTLPYGTLGLAAAKQIIEKWFY